jgi:S1-C subfamily serine protease
MSDIERELCPRCGEPAALSARVCPHCKGNLLVDVVLDEPPADARARYQAARAIGALGPPAPSFLAAQQTVGLPGAVLAAGVTRELARTLATILTEHGGKTHATGHRASEPATGSGRVSWPRVAVAVLAAAAIGLFAWTRFTAAPEEIEIPLASKAPRSTGPALSTRELAERATPSTVKLRCAGSEGSGFFIAEDLVLTNAHVLCPAGETIRAVFENGRELEGRTEKHDDWLDTALVRVPGAGAHPLPLGDALGLRTGDRVVFIGSPEGLDFTVHEGILSHSMRTVLGVAYLQIDANVNPGNSGGPLFDPQGRVVGIVSARVMGAEGLGFALPINYVYEGSAALVQAPSLAAESKGWQAVLAKVEEADRREVQALASASSRPALVGLAIVPGSGPAAVVLRLSRIQPTPEVLSFTLRTPERIVCYVSGGVRSWSHLGSASGSASRYVQWLDRNDLAKDVYQGLAELDLKGCPRGELQDAEIVLDGGDERADRIGI